MISKKENEFSGEVLYTAAYVYFGLVGPRQCIVAEKDMAKMDNGNWSNTLSSTHANN